MRTCSWSAYILFGVEHDEQNWSKLIQFGILFVLINNSSLYEVIVHCILSGAEHDERHETLIQIII